MSLEVPIRLRRGKDLESLRAYLRQPGRCAPNLSVPPGRAHYTVGESEAVYFNAGTGVRFVVAFVADRVDGGDEEGALCSVRVPLFRHVGYGHELAVEVAPLLEEMGFVDDDAYGDDEDVLDRVIESWNEGNRTAHTVLGETLAELPPAMPQRTLEAIWRWNHDRDERVEDLTESELSPCYVPLVVAVKDPARAALCTATVWPFPDPVLLPEVDVVIVASETRRQMISWQDLTPLLAGSRRGGPEVARTDAWDVEHPFGLGHIWVEEALDDGEQSQILGRARPMALEGVSLELVVVEDLLPARR